MRRWAGDHVSRRAAATALVTLVPCALRRGARRQPEPAPHPVDLPEGKPVAAVPRQPQLTREVLGSFKTRNDLEPRVDRAPRSGC